MENEWEETYKDYNYKELPWHTEKPEEILVGLVEQKKILPGRALDMCSGAGTNSLYLASKGFDVEGVDISETAVSIAKRRSSEHGLSCRFFAGDVLNPPVSGKFDLVFDRGCFHHLSVKDKPKYVKVVHDRLNNGGKFFLQCFSDKNPLFGKNLSKDDIYHYFGKHFEIKFIKDTIHTEPDSGRKVYLYTAFMEKMH